MWSQLAYHRHGGHENDQHQPEVSNYVKLQSNSSSSWDRNWSEIWFSCPKTVGQFSGPFLTDRRLRELRVPARWINFVSQFQPARWWIRSWWFYCDLDGEVIFIISGWRLPITMSMLDGMWWVRLFRWGNRWISGNPSVCRRPEGREFHSRWSGLGLWMTMDTCWHQWFADSGVW